MFTSLRVCAAALLRPVLLHFVGFTWFLAPYNQPTALPLTAKTALPRVCVYACLLKFFIYFARVSVCVSARACLYVFPFSDASVLCPPPPLPHPPTSVCVFFYFLMFPPRACKRLS